MKTHSVTLGGCLTALVLVSALPAYAQEQQDILLDEGTILDMLVVQAASDELRQALGVSNITSEDLLNRPVARDISEIVRTMPGVNLSGNTSTGQRGNQRQIDLRGMGPENTLILIDGRPVLSRNAVRPGRRGERDTRGDAGWIPPELIERIEVIRGPAAARYGSGAAGGVVNIITRQPEQLTMQVSTFLQIPEDSDEGGSRRVNALLAGPVNDMLTYRLTAGASWTDPDSPDINEEAAEDEDAPAGREGVVTYDFGALWSAQLDANHSVDLDVSWSRQSNIFAGDTLLSSPTDLTDALAEDGAETNTMERTSVALTHSGTYDFGVSESFIQWENTFNRRLSEGTAGGGEGAINTEEDYRVGILDNIIAKTEWDIPLFVLRDQTITLGAEYRGEFLESYTELADGTIEDFEGRYQEAHMLGLYVEDNILVTDQLTVTQACAWTSMTASAPTIRPASMSPTP
ncbi:TonB-dependent receptor plug domain-containing protein [Pelagibacterium sp. H642]|uniref:TonB-dependent receptor plug domain-containing protein n=1 Tax=Pelagibacterium sp. H642 TaxID=1881069 RepID=UPI002814B6A6|nr:TonB-dependent receptor plug domain-containing protein [Pelagibacterium sp. H642]WMT91273.1 TonB-dependent receptor plug domain-containing protein [Pelagibacterium sp. H642]